LKDLEYNLSQDGKCHGFVEAAFQLEIVWKGTSIVYSKTCVWFSGDVFRGSPLCYVTSSSWIYKDAFQVYPPVE
jgi:hypothetical protein